jgi:hypothetical protein
MSDGRIYDGQLHDVENGKRLKTALRHATWPDRPNGTLFLLQSGLFPSPLLVGTDI